MTRIDAAALSAACYDMQGSERDWLAAVLSVINPLLDAGMGVIAWPYKLGLYPPQEVPVSSSDPKLAEMLFGLSQQVSTATAERFCLGPRTASGTERLGRPLDGDEFAPMKPAGVVDFRALTTIDAAGHGIAFAAPSREQVTRNLASNTRLARVASHVLSGYRLRRGSTKIEAVLGPDAKLYDAEGEAKAQVHRNSLREAVKALDHLRSRKGARDPDATLESWRALISGRWSLVESYESDGRRFLLARRNPPGTLPSTALSPLEAQALVLRGQAASYKLIAYELGVSASFAFELVKRGARKLGIENDAELPALFGAAAGSALEEG